MDQCQYLFNKHRNSARCSRTLYASQAPGRVLSLETGETICTFEIKAWKHFVQANALGELSFAKRLTNWIDMYKGAK